MSPFGMSRSARAPLAELPDVIQRKIVATEIQQRVEQHGGVPAGEHESVAVDPVRVVRIVTQKAGPEQKAGWRQRHRSSGMPRLGLLDSIHGKGAYGVDGPPRQIGTRLALP